MVRLDIKIIAAFVLDEYSIISPFAGHLLNVCHLLGANVDQVSSNLYDGTLEPLTVAQFSPV